MPLQKPPAATSKHQQEPKKTKQRLPSVVGASSKKRPKPCPTVPVALPSTVHGGPALDIALVDLFAGLRTVHVAAEGTRINFVLTSAAEKCPFANALAKKNNIIETLFEEIHDMDKAWATNFVAEALCLNAAAILLAGGFPCKGLSRA